MPSTNLKKTIALFENDPVRRVWNREEEKWYFSVVDVVRILTESNNPTDYLKKLRKRDVKIGNYLGTICPQVEMMTSSGKKRKILAGNTEQILRIIQSIPSPKAEPFKLWLAKVGYERMRESIDPELAISRARRNWQLRGHSQKWIERRMLSVETRNKLTDYWSGHEVNKAAEYAKLTNIIHEEWSGLSVREHKDLKGLEVENLRDHMSEAELIFTSLAELSTREIAEASKAIGYEKNEVAARKGGNISGNARKELESQTGRHVIAGDNNLGMKKIK